MVNIHIKMYLMWHRQKLKYCFMSKHAVTEIEHQSFCTVLTHECVGLMFSAVTVGSHPSHVPSGLDCIWPVCRLISLPPPHSPHLACFVLRLVSSSARLFDTWTERRCRLYFACCPHDVRANHSWNAWLHRVPHRKRIPLLLQQYRQLSDVHEVCPQAVWRQGDHVHRN